MKGAEEGAGVFVSKHLLQNTACGYRVHDLVLDYMQTKIKTDWDRTKRATELQAEYLGRLDVVNDYVNPKHGAGNRGLFQLDSLWRSVETLSGNSTLEVASYKTSLEKLEPCEATEELARIYSSVGMLFDIQVRHVRWKFLRRSEGGWCSISFSMVK